MKVERYTLNGCCDMECSCAASMDVDKEGEWVGYLSYKKLKDAVVRILTYKTDSGFCNGSSLVQDIAALESAICEEDGKDIGVRPNDSK